MPSLFRGVVVADSPLGVGVVSVEERSQASLGDLRPEDVIVRVQQTEIHSIDEFAALSAMLKGRAVSVSVLVFRNGLPRELTLHLYSYPVLQEWGVAFVPEHDIRFAEPQVGLAHWTRLGRGFEEAGKLEPALDAYLNGLHNVPTDIPAALKVTELLSRLSQPQLASGALTEGLERLRQALTMMERLFHHPLTEAQLHSVRTQLQDTLRALHQAMAAHRNFASRNFSDKIPRPWPGHFMRRRHRLVEQTAV